VEIPTATGIFCIDRTEVTNAQYAAFLASKPTGGSLPASCAYRVSSADFAPFTDSNDCNQYDPSGMPSWPVACIDWCDAQAYCQWAGKHLCGKIGGGTNAPADFVDPAKSEWFTTCSHDGTREFPYGDTFQKGTCAGLQNSNVTRPVQTGSLDCQGGYDGVYDMSGNVAEWEDSCSGTSGATDQCLQRGGSYLADLSPYPGDTATLRCNSNIAGTPKAATKARSTRDKQIGFRCCYDP